MLTNRRDTKKPYSIGKAITPLVLTAFVVILAASLYLKSHYSRPQSTSSFNRTATTTARPSASPGASRTPTPSPTADSYAGWNTYSNSDFGFAFRYPSNWGEVRISHKAGDTGTIFSGEFSANSLLTFAGQTPDYTVGIGAGFLNFFGCTKNTDGTYACAFAPGKATTITPTRVLTTADGNTAVVVFGMDIPQVLSTTTRGALVNLSGKKYPGIAFQYLQIPPQEAAVFDQVIESVKSL